MVEGEANFISEDDFLKVIEYGHKTIKEIVILQEELVKICGKKKREIVKPEINNELINSINKLIKGKISQ